MRKVVIILGIVAAVISLILAVTPLSQIAYLPSVVALIFGFVAFYISKQKQKPQKTINLIFLMTFIALIITTYKALFIAPEIGDLEAFELKEEASMEDSKELLESLDIDDTDIEMEEYDNDTTGPEN